MSSLPRDDAYENALAFLYGRLNYERVEQMPYDPTELRLDRMRSLLQRLGNPHDQLNIVHVAGSKGKGSTAHFLSSILTQAGYRTGCYTSPHLLGIEERFAVDGQPCSSRDIVDWVDHLRPVVAQMDGERSGATGGGPTFFELATAIAFLHFQRQATDFTILEVGMGGRLDSTNVCSPRLSIITSISFDHMRQLGNTLGAIAREKAGIIKRGVPLITGVVEDEPWQVIRQVAQQQNAPVHRLGRDFEFVYHAPEVAELAARSMMDYFRRHGDRREQVAEQIELSALGAHQAANGTLAWTAAEQLVDQGIAIPVSAMRRGLASARCAARIEVLGRRPTVIVDTAHNRASIEALIQVLRESFPQQPRTLILAATKGKDIDGMLHVLIPDFDTVICTQYQHNPRGMPTDELLRHTRRVAASEGCVADLLDADSPRAAWDRAISLHPTPATICATGSFFLAAEMKRILPGPHTK